MVENKSPPIQIKESSETYLDTGADNSSDAAESHHHGRGSVSGHRKAAAHRRANGGSAVLHEKDKERKSIDCRRE